jgi:hypothetical protein
MLPFPTNWLPSALRRILSHDFEDCRKWTSALASICSSTPQAISCTSREQGRNSHAEDSGLITLKQATSTFSARFLLPQEVPDCWPTYGPAIAPPSPSPERDNCTVSSVLGTASMFFRLYNLTRAITDVLELERSTQRPD